MTKIPTRTILLLCATKIFPPWMDTWSDGAMIYRLWTFGQEWKEFNVTTLDNFLDVTWECSESEYYDNGAEQWIKKDSILSYKYNGHVVWYDKEVFESQNITDMLWYDQEVFESQNITDLVWYDQEVFERQNITRVRIKKHYTNWAFAAFLPVLVCLIFTGFFWWSEEEGWTKISLFPILCMGLYSQYRAVKIILIGLGKWPGRKQDDWIEEKAKFTRQTVSLEPTTEALPSLLIQVFLLSTEVYVLFFGSRPGPLGENSVLFVFSFGFTILLTVMGLTHFLKDGPSPLITSEDGYMDGFISKKYAGLFFCIFFWFMAKCLVLVGVVEDFFLIDSEDLNLDRLGIGYADKRIRLLLWASFLILPQLIHAILVLAISTKSNLFSLSINFPSFIITPMFTPFTYKASSTDGEYEFRVSQIQSLINILLTILLTPVAMFLFYMDDYWKATYSFGPTPATILEYNIPYIRNRPPICYSHDNDTQIADMYACYNISACYTTDKDTFRTVDKHQKDLDHFTTYTQVFVFATVLLPFILLLFALIPANFLLRTSKCSPCGQHGAGKYRNGIKLRKTGPIRWEVKMEDVM